MKERKWADEYRQHRIEPRKGERITHDNTYGKVLLDEIVLRGVTVHVEAMSKRNYVIILSDDERTVYLNARDVWIYESEGIDGLTDLGVPQSWDEKPTEQEHKEI